MFCTQSPLFCPSPISILLHLWQVDDTRLRRAHSQLSISAAPAVVLQGAPAGIPLRARVLYRGMGAPGPG